MSRNIGVDLARPRHLIKVQLKSKVLQLHRNEVRDLVLKLIPSALTKKQERERCCLFVQKSLEVNHCQEFEQLPVLVNKLISTFLNSCSDDSMIGLTQFIQDEQDDFQQVKTVKVQKKSIIKKLLQAQAVGSQCMEQVLRDEGIYDRYDHYCNLDGKVPRLAEKNLQADILFLEKWIEELALKFDRH